MNSFIASDLPHAGDGGESDDPFLTGMQEVHDLLRCIVEWYPVFGTCLNQHKARLRPNSRRFGRMVSCHVLHDRLAQYRSQKYSVILRVMVMSISRCVVAMRANTRERYREYCHHNQ